MLLVYEPWPNPLIRSNDDELLSCLKKEGTSSPNYTDVINVTCVRKSLSCTMEQEMVSTPVDNAPAFLQLRDKYKQDLVEDTRLTKAADLAAK